MRKIPLLFMVINLSAILNAQINAIDTSPKSKNWTEFNRHVKFANDIIHLDANANDGLLWLNNSNFENGTIELDIKGLNKPGQSFVGLAFHGVDNNTYDAVYFRPFNFQNQERSSHSMQYISMPKYDWKVLRDEFPGKYENKIENSPDPLEWIHTKIEINYPNVKVYVNGSSTPDLVIEQISQQKSGMVGLWVGNGSEGWFKNVKIVTNK